MQVANGSNLILDPDLDTYYLMDTLIAKLPTAADQAGRTKDLALVGDAMEQRVALASAQNSLQGDADRALAPASTPRSRRPRGRP